MPVAVFGVDGETAAEDAQPVAVIDVAAVLAEVAADQAPAVAELDRVGDVVAAPILAAHGADLLRRGRYRLLPV